jgi:hypothetical protein
MHDTVIQCLFRQESRRVQAMAAVEGGDAVGGRL